MKRKKEDAGLRPLSVYEIFTNQSKEVIAYWADFDIIECREKKANA